MNRPLYLMKCGHIALAKTQDGKPACPICLCEEVEKEVKETEGLEGRTAMCDECANTTPSKWTLPFFEHRKDQETDSYYCGCNGWD